MAEQLKILNLALDTALHVAADKFLARDDLEGNLLAGAAVDSQLDLAEGALAERLDNVVGADALLGAHLVAHGQLGVGVAWQHDGGVDGADGSLAVSYVALSLVPADLRGRQGDGQLLVVVGLGHAGDGYRGMGNRFIEFRLCGWSMWKRSPLRQAAAVRHSTLLQ